MKKREQKVLSKSEKAFERLKTSVIEENLDSLRAIGVDKQVSNRIKKVQGQRKQDRQVDELLQSDDQEDEDEIEDDEDNSDEE